ncbi:endonuclease/exonuclease/phosphatase family protein [Dongia sp.]|uniref:endonuclease/exonuclease/phosphatase family protein n=1 Tax=Dongia sp. TaxID=1977262 RepID=UPI0035B35DBE
MPEDYVTDQPAGTLAQDEPRARRGPFLRFLHTALIASSLALVFATFLPLVHPYWPLADVAEHFALQILLAAGILAALAVVLRRWRWLSVIGAIAFIQAWTIHPYWPHASSLAEPLAGEARLKMVSLNVWYRNDEMPRVIDYLRSTGADVIGLVEVRAQMLPQLAALNDLYPYRLECVSAAKICQELLLSKYPFRSSGKGRIDGQLPVLVWGEIKPQPNAPPVTIAVTHLAWPFKKISPAAAPALGPNRQTLPQGMPRLLQSDQAVRLTGALNQLGGDLVLMGDFNMAPWARAQMYLRQSTGLDNQGHLAPSWPAWAPAALRLPIDHIMTRGAPQILTLAAGPAVGSDHRPVEAILGFAEP